MEKYFIVNGSVYINHRFQDASLELSDGVIHIVESGAVPEDCRIIDAGGKRVVPGFIDVHTHGADGVDVNGADAEALRRAGRFFAGNGTTSWLASVLTDTKEQTEWCIGQLMQLDQSEADSSHLLGIHLEGPFLSEKYKGAMPEQLLAKPSLGLIQGYQELARGNIRYITVAPETEGMTELIPELVRLGITVAIGHSEADYDTSVRAIEAGAACSTHTFNAMRLLHQHEPAILGAALEKDIYCEMICDGIHLHPGIVRLLWKIKGKNRIVAVTDSIMAAGLPDGVYRLGVNEVEVKCGDARLMSDGTRAGSTLTQISALRNSMSFTGLKLEELLPGFTENPARLIGVFGQKGSIQDGKDADILILDERLCIDAVFLRGRLFTQHE